MKLFLIDGHALIFKMYYAFLGRHIVNSRGVDTSILFGFTKYLLELVERERPTHLAVSFDPPGGTFRNSLYPEYKANRAETPQLVIDALEPLTGIVRAMNVPVLMVPGYEADDVIGTAAKRFASDGLDVFMVTPDKDYGQLVGPHIWQYRPGKSGSDNEVLGEAEVCAKWKISSASQVIDMLTLCGDSSDNVPGVQGVGPVGAAKLLSQYSSVDGIYEHLDELTPRQQQLFRAAGDHMALSRELVTIRTDVPLELGVDDMKLGNVRTAELEALMDEYEFPSLKRILQKLSPEAPAPVSASAAPAVPELRAVAPSGIGGSRVALNLKSAKLYVAADGKCASGSPGDFRALLEDAAVVKVGAGLKSQMNALADAGVELRGRLEDVELMHYLLNPESSHSLGRLAMGYLGVALDDAGPAEPAGLFDDAPAEDESGALRETAVLLPLADRLNAEIDRTEGMRRLYDEIEEPLLSVLSRMERTGVKVADVPDPDGEKIGTVVALYEFVPGTEGEGQTPTQRNYTLCLILEEGAQALPQREYYTEADGKAGYTSNSVGLYNLPLMRTGNTATRTELAKNTPVTVLGTLHAPAPQEGGWGLDADYCFVSCTVGGAQVYGYVPAAYINESASTGEVGTGGESLTYRHLKAGESVTLGRADGSGESGAADSIDLADGELLTVHGEADENGLVLVSYERDGVLYTGRIEESKLERASTFGIWIIVAVTIVTIAVLISTCYLILRKTAPPQSAAARKEDAAQDPEDDTP